MSSTAQTRQLVTAFWAAMQANDWAAAAALFADDYVLEWPQSGERIRGAANFVAINAAYPAAGRWRFSVERLVVEGELAVTDVAVGDGAVTARAITFTTVRAGRIAGQDFGELRPRRARSSRRAVEYWPDPFDPPAWRADWVERAGML